MEDNFERVAIGGYGNRTPKVSLHDGVVRCNPVAFVGVAAVAARFATESLKI